MFSVLDNIADKEPDVVILLGVRRLSCVRPAAKGRVFAMPFRPKAGADRQSEGRRVPNRNRPHHPVNGHPETIPHFEVVLTPAEWDALARRIKHAGVKFVVEPFTRFAGEPGERSTMFLLDPSGDALEFKCFANLINCFRRDGQTHFNLASGVHFGQRSAPALISGADKVSALLMLRYRFSVKFIGRHLSGMPGPSLNIEN